VNIKHTTNEKKQHTHTHKRKTKLYAIKHRG